MWFVMQAAAEGQIALTITSQFHSFVPGVFIQRPLQEDQLKIFHIYVSTDVLCLHHDKVVGNYVVRIFHSLSFFFFFPQEAA